MASQRTSGTDPELAVRSALHRQGLRFRVHRAPVDGVRSKADIVFGPARVAVFVDGCFWHSCPEHATSPKANAGWWSAKLAANQERDRRTDAALQAAGWGVVRVWEHEAPLEAAARIAEVVNQRRPER
jgi:DNA mismatch endonuclease (patch repair protein)